MRLRRLKRVDTPLEWPPNYDAFRSWLIVARSWRIPGRSEARLLPTVDFGLPEARLWKQIVKAVEEMQRTEPAIGEVLQ